MKVHFEKSLLKGDEASNVDVWRERALDRGTHQCRDQEMWELSEEQGRDQHGLYNILIKGAIFIGD